MSTSLMLGQILRGEGRLYTITRQLQDCVWLATNQHQEKVVAESVRHFRLQNERDVLLRFQHRTPFIRPLIDQVEDTAAPTTLILKYLDDNALDASNNQRLTRAEVKHVARRMLEGLVAVHDEEFVYTDIKRSNVLVNYGHGDVRFRDVQLADFGSTVHVDSAYSRNGYSIGTPIFRSPEAHLQMKWDTATDIWSFGTMSPLRHGFHIFKPDVPVDHDEYDLKILLKHHRCFGPFPVLFEDIADQDRLAVLVWVMQNSPTDTLKPFHLTTPREICQEDKEFVVRSMKLDPRDRATARQLLEDGWFRQA